MCKLMENGRVIFEGNWDACQAYMEQEVTKDRERMIDTICEVKHGYGYYSRIENETLARYELAIIEA